MAAPLLPPINPPAPAPTAAPLPIRLAPRRLCAFTSSPAISARLKTNRQMTRSIDIGLYTLALLMLFPSLKKLKGACAPSFKRVGNSRRQAPYQNPPRQPPVYITEDRSK